MGYHLTILRTKGREHRPINGEELGLATGSIPELHYDAANQTVVFSLAGETRANLFLQNGEVWTSNPDRDVITMMLRLAEALGGRLRGDEMETYRTPDKSYAHPDDREEAKRGRDLAAEIKRQTRRRSILLHTAIAGFFICFALIVSQCSA